MKSDVVMKLTCVTISCPTGTKGTRIFGGFSGGRQPARCVLGRMESILQNIRRSNEP